MTVVRRTWPYGTMKRVRVTHVEKGFAICTEPKEPPAKPEGWILTGVDFAGVEVGQERTIVFRQGGPTGGHWDFERQEAHR